ncbi:MAG: lipase secretion chaperone [Aquabacterium sp.]|jgi:lipase chaperone LimK|uniref:lipase secretion chaperone n=1 Tax=Aquabacterium sp. TaxID=1872578 RepID=UPI002A358BA6|nr:lipase secretion chaperone [Aquabacterium sp.]MDX9844188.1 lipase secretion chaperone [Aquabacterium sp.]
MNKTFVAALSALSLLVVVVLMWPDPPSSDDASGLPGGTATSPSTPAASENRFPWETTGSAARTSATLDQLRPQPDGRLQLSGNTRDVLDTFLSEHPRAAPEVIAAQFREAAQAHLSEPALSEAADLMTRYAAYQDALRATQTQPTPAPNVEPGLAAILQWQQTSALREQFLGSTFKEALYGQEEQMQRYQLARQQILSVQGWSEQQRNEELAALEREYPRAVVEAAGQGTR